MTDRERERGGSSSGEVTPERARPLVLAAPSGTGKTTIARALVDGSPDFVFSVSATTRPPRKGERRGRDYAFVDEETFRLMEREGELLEWAVVHGHRYGTPGQLVAEAARTGKHVVLDIDVQGAMQIRERVPDALLVFVLPPSAEALVERLSGRGTEARKEMVRRLRNAREELLYAPRFDRAVVNEDLAGAVERVRRLVEDETELDADTPWLPRGRTLEDMIERLRDEIDDVLKREFAASGPTDS